jgi:polysaccharide export outer membrane protein
MKLSSMIAVALFLGATLSMGQTAPANDTAPVPPSGTPQASPAANPAFKPSPQEQPFVPGNTGTAPVANKTTPTTGSARPPAAAPKGSAAQTAVSAKSDRYVLGPLDVVAVTVFDEGHVPGTYPIGPDGWMSMPLIGEFKAIGLTLRQLQDLITEKLSAFIIDPVVNVQLLRNNSKQYMLVGGVMKEGSYPLQRDTTILEALAAAGCCKDFANPKKIVLRRGTQVFHFNYKDVIHGKHMEQNIKIEDGDMIVVPE